MEVYKLSLKSFNRDEISTSMDIWFFFLFGITLPLSISLNHISIFLIAARFIFISIKARKVFLLWRKSYLSLLPVYFLVVAASLLYTSDLKNGLKELEKLIYFFIIPLSFSIIPLVDIRAVVRKISLGFVLGNVILGLKFIFHYLSYDWHDAATDEVIQNIAPLHPTYLSLFFSISIILCAQIVFEKKLIRFISRISILFFAALIILSASKLGVIFLFVSLLYVAFVIIKNSSRLIGFSFIIISLVSLTFIAIRSEVLLDRIARIMSLEVQRHPVEGFNTFSGRLFFWKCAAEISSKHFLLGVGIGDSQYELDLCYMAKEETVTEEFLKTYNAHNQFLQTLLESGITGLLVLFALCFILMQHSIRNNELVSFLITFLIILFFLFESVLARDKGIVFFSSFATILYYWFAKLIRKQFNNL